ncbi:unnamed protein product [Rotaria sp. Silwood1]|nr:unnamed protein product [Rotaria sp. Silwood1]
MVMPVLKCPYLAQLTLQQVRASAPNILNAGAESCPIFGQLIRKISTTGVNNSASLNVSSSSSMNFDDIKAVHESFIGRKTSDKVTIPTGINKKVNPYDEIIVSTECEDILCPFLKTTPITLRRLNNDQHTNKTHRKFEKIINPMVNHTNLFHYNNFFDEKIEAKKRDNSYRVFKRVQRKSGLFPQAEVKKNLDDDKDSRTITVWCIEHPSVAEAQVFSIPDERHGEEVCAWIKLKPNAPPCQTEDMTKFLADKLAFFKIPKHIRFVDKFIMTPTGKVQKFKLSEAMVNELKEAKNKH